MSNICPNKSHPDWKVLVERLGEIGAYKAFIQNGNNIPSPNKVNYNLRAVDILQSPKADEIFRKGDKNNWSLDKILQELQVPKEQQVLIKDIVNSINNTARLDLNYNLREEIITSLLANYSYTIEINTGKAFLNARYFNDGEFAIHNSLYYERDGEYFQEAGGETYPISKETYDRMKKTVEEYTKKEAPNSQYYSNLTVPGGTNYTENEIATPAITPAIKGHAQFSTDKGIGHFRSDDRQKVKGKGIYTKEQADKDLKEGKISQFEYDMASSTFDKESPTETDTKTRRILEVQSDLFQKGRDSKDLISLPTIPEYEIEKLKNELTDKAYTENWTQEKLDIELAKVDKLEKDSIKGNDKQNQFLQLLNKDNNWVTFFIKSIIQDSAKKGYEKVLFPTGNTASKVEGHSTLEEFKKQKEDRIKQLEEQIKRTKEFPKADSLDAAAIDTYNTEINQIKQELERVEKEGFAALAPIFKFYEETVSNILKKQGYNPVLITDEYGNTWNSIDLDISYFSSISLALSSSLLTGFKNYSEQQQSVDTLASAVLYQMQREGKTLNQAFDVVKSEVDSQVELEARRFIPIQQNFDKIKELIKDKFFKIGLLERPSIEEDEADIDGIEGPDVDVNYWKDDWVLSFDSKKNALEAVKAFLAFIPKTEYKDGELVDVSGFLKAIEIDEDGNKSLVAYPQYMSYDEVYDTLKGILANNSEQWGQSLNTWESMRKVLESNIETKPWIGNLLYQIDNYEGDKQRLLNQFVSTMSSVYAGAETVLWKETKGTYDLKVVAADQNSVQSHILSMWNNNFKRTSFLVEDENGNLVLDQDKVKSLNQRIKSLIDNPNIKAASKILKDIGIELSEKTEKELEGRLKREVASKGLFRLLESKLREWTSDTNDEEDGELIEYNPIINNSRIRLLARDEAKFGNFSFTNSYINGEGNMVQSFMFNNSLTLEFRKLFSDKTYRELLLKLPFTSPLRDNNGSIVYSNWINEIHTNEIFKEVFNIVPFDTIREQRTGKDGIKITKSSPLDIEAIRIGLLQNRGTYRKGVNKGKGRIMKYLFTTPSKTMSYVVTHPAIDIEFYGDTTDNFKLSGDIKTALYSIAASEWNRIIHNQKADIQNTAFERGGKKFLFFESLNNLPIFHPNGDVMLPTTRVGDKTAEQLVKVEIERLIKAEVQETISRWKDLGVIKTKQNKKKENIDYLSIVDNAYASKVLTYGPNETKKILHAVLDYVVNNHLAAYNLHQTVIGDPAHFWKTSVRETWENIDKRKAGVIAPRKELSLTNQNEEFIYLHLNDREKNNYAINYAQLVKRLGDKAAAYKDINGTDAVEYVTFKEDLDFKYKLGLIPTDVYNNVLERYSKEKDNFVLTKEELSIVLGATKPVYFSSRVSEAEGTVYKDYVKSAAIPLIPEFTVGLEIDKLRKAMESLQEKRGLNVRAAFKSAQKVGGKQFINIFNEDGTIKDDIVINDENFTKVNRQGLGQQQDVPYKEADNEVSKSTQVTKLLFDSILSLDGFQLGEKTLSGQQLFENYKELHRRLYSNALEELHNRILDEKGNLKEDVLQQVLLEEAKSRNYSDAEISWLGLNEAGRFKNKLWLSPSSEKFEALLTSLYSNKVVKQKMNGRSYVLASEEGIRGISKGITYTKAYDPNTGLKPQRIVYRKGKSVLEEDAYQALQDKSGYVEEVAPSQVLIPWNFRHKSGKVVDIKKFINKDGLIDTKKLSPKLLKLFGLRIPNQGHNSMSYMEVVGFLPEIMGDVVIASRNLVTQMGSDFDIDKLYTYQHEYLITSKQNIRKRLGSIKNSLLDIHLSVVSNIQLFDQIVTPLGLGKLKETPTKGIAVDVKKYYEGEKVVNSYLSPNRDLDKYLQSTDGKRMVGITALISTFSSLLYQTQKEITPLVPVKTAKGIKFVASPVTVGKIINGNRVRVELDTISNSNTAIEGTRKLYAVSAFLSAAVDNEKDPILSYLNINPETADIFTYLLHLGLEEDYVGAFMAQPVLSEYTKLKKIRQGSFKSGEYKNDSELLSELISKYYKLVAVELGTGFRLDGLEEFPLAFEDLMSTFWNKKNTPVVFNDQSLTLTFNQIQLLTLLKAQTLKEKGEFLSRMQSTLNIDSRGIGASLMDVADRVSKIESFFRSKSFENIHELLATQEESRYIPNTVLGYSVFYGLMSGNDRLNGSGLYPYSHPIFHEILKGFIPIIDKKLSKDFDEKNLTLNQKKDIWKGIKSYMFSNPQLYGFETIEELQQYREDLFFDRNGNKSLATEIEELRNDPRFSRNPFIIRLITDINKNGRKPSLVLYSATKQEPLDGNNTLQGLSEIINTPDTAEIGKKLIHYFYLNGGNQSAKEWGKFIDADYLEQIGFTEVLNKQRLNIEEPSMFIEQFVQHNPQILPLLRATQEILDRVTYDGGNFNEAVQLNLPSDKGRDVIKEVVQGNGYYKYISVPNKNARKGYALFKFDSIGNDGTHVYKRIPVLGDKFYNEYVMETPKAESLITKKFENTVETPVKDVIEPIADTKQILNTSKTYGPAVLVNDTIENVLNSLKTNSDNNNHKLLTQLLESASSLIGQGRVILDTELQTADGYPIKGQFSNVDGKYEIRINPNGFTDPQNIEEWERVLIHEIIHAATYAAFFGDNYQTTKTQQESFDRLRVIFNTIRTGVLNGEYENIGLKAEELQEFELYYGKLKRGESLTQEEFDRIGELQEKYYPLSSYTKDGKEFRELPEFITLVLTEPAFQEILNNIKYDGRKTFLDRIIDLISKILAEFSIYTPTGRISVNQESALSEALKNTLPIFQFEQKKKSKSLFDTTRKVDPNDIRELNNNFALKGRKINEQAGKRYSKVINSFRTRIILLNDSIAKAYVAKDLPRAKELEQRKKEIEESLEEILENNILSTVVEHAHNDLDRAKALLDKDFVSSNDIVYIKRVVNTWKTAPELLLTKDAIGTNNYELVSELRGRALTIEDQWTVVAQKSMLDMMKETSNMENLTEDILSIQERVNSFTANLLDISRSGSTMLSVVDLWMRQAAFDTNLEVQEIINTIQTLSKDLATTEEFKSNGYDVFAQVDKDGNRTGNLVTPLDESYYRERDRLLQYARDEKNPKSRSKKFKRYFDWVKENHFIVDNRKLFNQDKDGMYQYNPDQAYLEEVNKQFGDQAEDIINLLKDRVARYNEELEAKETSVLGEPDAVRIVEEWKLENDPNIYLQNLLDGYVERKAGTKVIINKGFRFTVKRVIDKWEDPKYKTIKSDPKLKAYYDFATNTLRKLYGYLPLAYKEDLEYNSLPYVSKSLMEQFNEGGLRGGLKGLKEGVFAGLTIPANVVDLRGLKDPATGETIRRFAVKFTEKGDPELQSYDLTRVIQLFSLEAVAFKHKSRVEDQIRMAEFFVKEALELQRRPDGLPQKDKFGEVITNKGIKNLEEQFSYALDAFWGNRRKEQGVSSKAVAKLGFEPEFNYIENYIKTLNKDEEYTELPPQRIKEAIKVIAKLPTKEEKIAALDELKLQYGRYFTAGRVGDAVLQYVQIKGMGWNPFSAMLNLIVGYSSNLTWSAGGADFNPTDFRKANGLMLSSLLDSKLSNKITRLMQKFDTLKEINEAAYESITNNNGVRKGMKKLAPLEMQRLAEKFVQGQTMLAMMLNTKIKVGDKEINLFEAFDENGEWNTELYGENQDWQTIDSRAGNKAFEFKVRMDQVLKSIHGNYDPNSAVRIKQGVLGRGLMQFRSWVAEGFLQRIGDEKYDMLLKRNVKGRYITYKDLGFKQSIKVLAQLSTGQGDKAFEKLFDSKGRLIEGDALRIVKENMRKNLVGLAQLVFFTGLTYTLENLAFDDDDDEKRMVRNYLINMSIRLTDDLLFYSSPGSFENITRTAIPAASLITDAYKFLDAAGQAIVGEDTIPTGIKAGDSRLAWRTAKLFPFTSAISTQLNKALTQESFRK